MAARGSAACSRLGLSAIHSTIYATREGHQLTPGADPDPMKTATITYTDDRMLPDP